jgi:Tfp pilus assembly protein PilO
MNMNSVFLRGQLDRLGIAGVVGIALFVFCAALYVSTLAPLAKDVQGLHSETAALQLRMSAAPPQRSLNTAERLQNFHAFFPPLQSTPEWLAKIEAAAQRNGLQLQSGEYKLERHADQPLIRYQMLLPVAGSYPQIRGFLADVLETLPAASIDDIALQRDDPSQPVLHARVRLSLYLRAQ